MQNVGIFAGRQNIYRSFIYMAHANQYVVVCYAFLTRTHMSEWKRLTKCEMRHYFPREHLLTPLELAFLVFYCHVDYIHIVIRSTFRLGTKFKCCSKKIDRALSDKFDIQNL